MIISHKYKFIFIKTRKTAGTSIETYLSPFCGPDDILTPILPHEEGHEPRNFKGFFNPIPELLAENGSPRRALKDFALRRRYFNHIPGWRVRARTPPRVWSSYFKFCVERNPWDKTLSQYHYEQARRGITLDDYIADGRFPTNYAQYTERGDASSLIVDRVLSYETLNDDLAEVLTSLGIPFPGSLGIQAKSGFRKDRRHYSEVLTDDQRRTIEKAFEREIRLFDFTY